MATFPISDDRINLDLFPSEPCPTLPTQGQVWPQGLFLGSYVSIPSVGFAATAGSEFVDPSASV